MNRLHTALLALPLLASPCLATAQEPEPTPPADLPPITDPFVDPAPAEPAPVAEPSAEPPPPPELTYASAPVAADYEEPASEDEEVDEDDGDLPTLSIGLKAGLLVPNIVNDLGMHAIVSLEVAYYLPFLNHQLALQFEASYAPPGVDGSQDDPRIGAAGDEVSWSQRTHETSFALGPTFRFVNPNRTVVPYVSVLGRVYLLKTHVEGSAGGQTFGENDEVSTRIGVTGALGVDIDLGPGRLLVEVGSGWSQLPHATTGDTSTTALTLQLGYRFAF